ncbi:phosphate ABC transporter permease [Arthrobacter sp. Soil736]|uniref:phosphate ABC transporter permease subunit PstC n=1 Tax=Arthrobacter sp. Soil736 TaxID=1736395 RepID=UPI0006FE3C9F|nr:phosphate ABC transporter permease subunit PstC [Arthrobacter sp. Soil736]KRE54826.1 phosphate ABC transporter permease [Arthrobacter sp. Soil736]
MSTYLPEYHPEQETEATARPLTYRFEPKDYVFRSITRSGGIIVLVVMAMVGIFLASNGISAINEVGLWKFLTTQNWAPESNDFGIAAVLWGTVQIALVALLVAMPLSLGTSLFITEVARGWVQRTLTSLIDLLAAVPSVVFGLWGAYMLQPNIVDFSKWISVWFGWIPMFQVEGVDPASPLRDTVPFTASTFIAGLVVAMMIVPIQTSIMTESFRRAPIGEREGAFALGATRWGMIRTVVLPFGQGGIIGGTMLGLGRALGETIAIYLIISPVFEIKFHILEKGANSIAAMIALKYSESNEFAMSALMAAGFALFIVTMLVNFTASAIIARSRSGAESEG